MANKNGFPIAILIMGLLISWCYPTFAQDMTSDIEMADLMRSSGKIYVVVAVLSIVFIGIIGYLVHIDRKLTRLERKIAEKK